MDDLLLGPMEDIAVFEKLNLVSLDEVYEVFATYLDICVQSNGLREYLAWSREEPEDADVRENLLNLHDKMKKKFPRQMKK